jgi:capsular polysaccharide biosynthesis protein
VDLTPHEKKILELIRKYPKVITDPAIRREIAEKNNLSEKTLRNRIADFKKYGLLDMDKKIVSEKSPKYLTTENDEIDLLTVFNILAQQKWSILKRTGLFTTIGIIYSLLATPYFQSTISLYPAGEITESSSIFGGNLKGVAESFGFGGLGSSPTYNIPDIINSRRLKKDIVLKSWTNSLYPNGSNLIKYWGIDKPTWFAPRKWISKLFPAGGFSANPYQQYVETAIKNLGELISVEEEASGLINVSVLMEEPELSADIANYIAEFVKDFILVEQHREAVKNKAFIYDQRMQELTEFRKQHPIALDTPDLQLARGRLIRNIEENQAVYITLRQQYEIAKIEEAKESLLVNILDVGEPAVENAKPRRTRIIIIGFVLSLIFSTYFIYFRERWKKLQTYS